MDDVKVLVDVLEINKFIETFVSHMSDNAGDGRSIKVRLPSSEMAKVVH